MLNREKKISPGASVHISGLHLYAFLSPNLNFYACRSKMLNVTLIHRTITIDIYVNVQIKSCILVLKCKPMQNRYNECEVLK